MERVAAHVLIWCMVYGDKAGSDFSSCSTGISSFVFNMLFDTDSCFFKEQDFHFSLPHTNTQNLLIQGIVDTIPFAPVDGLARSPPAGTNSV